MQNDQYIEHILTRLDENPKVTDHQLAAFEGWLDAQLPTLIEDGFRKTLFFIIENLGTDDTGKLERLWYKVDMEGRRVEERIDEFEGSYVSEGYVLIDGVQVLID